MASDNSHTTEFSSVGASEDLNELLPAPSPSTVLCSQTSEDSDTHIQQHTPERTPSPHTSLGTKSVKLESKKNRRPFALARGKAGKARAVGPDSVPYFQYRARQRRD